MKNLLNRFNLFFLYLALLLYLEILSQYFMFGNFLSANLLQITLFLVPIAFGLYLISALLKRKINRVIIIVLFTGCFIIYFSQFIFYQTFDRIYSLSATQQAHAIGEFFNFVLQQITNNLLPSLLFILPVILVIIFHKKLLHFKPQKPLFLLISLLIVTLIHFTTIYTLNDEGIYSNHNLYFKVNEPTLTAEQMGLITAARLDLMRLITGFEADSDFIDTKDPEEKPPDDENDEAEPVKYNKMTIDWDELIAEETDETIKQMHEYFKNQEPTEQNEWTGKFADKNLVWILAESLDHIAIDETITPTLYQLADEGLNFTNFYTPIYLSTIDGEYMTKTGLLPKNDVWSLYRSHENYLPFTMGHQLQAKDYTTRAYHNNTHTYYRRHLSHPNLGYDDFIACGSGLDINCQLWPQSDQEMIDATVPDLLPNAPFAAYYLTISGHLQYNRYNQMAIRHWDEVADLPYSEAIRCYLAQHIEFDKALASLIAQLEEEDLAEDTVIAISSDHWPYGLTTEQLNERSDEDRSEFFERDRLPFIIWHDGIEGKEIDTLGSTIDILPTLLNLFGIEYDSRLMVGEDIFADNDPIVIYSNHNWETEKGRYYRNEDRFVPKKDEEDIPDNYTEQINKEIYNRFQMSRRILENDYYRHVFE